MDKLRCVCVCVRVCTVRPFTDNPTILDSMRPGRVRFGSPFLPPPLRQADKVGLRGVDTEINNTPLSPRPEPFVCSDMHAPPCTSIHVMSSPLWFHMHNWSIHYWCLLERVRVCVLNVDGCDLEGQTLAVSGPVLSWSRQTTKSQSDQSSEQAPVLVRYPRRNICWWNVFVVRPLALDSFLRSEDAL